MQNKQTRSNTKHNKNILPHKNDKIKTKQTRTTLGAKRSTLNPKVFPTKKLLINL